MNDVEKIILIIFFVTIRIRIFLLETKVKELEARDGEQE